MSLVFILFMLFLAFCFTLLKKKKSSFIMVAFALFFFISIGDGYLPATWLTALQKPFINQPSLKWGKHNVIILLGAGTVKLVNSTQVLPTLIAYSRINTTAEIYQDCIKKSNQCTIIISGGDAAHTGQSEAVIYQKDLLKLGVKPADIILETNSLNTYKNAEFTHEILQKREVDNIFLVTSGLHLRRSLLYFSHFGITATPVLADYLPARLTLIPQGYNFTVADFALNEYIGILRFHIYNLLGLNKKPN